MVNNPVVGGTYWMAVDWWEQYAAVPVTIISQHEDGTYTARWTIYKSETDCGRSVLGGPPPTYMNDICEDYPGTTPGQLYPSEFCALVEIKHWRAKEGNTP